VTPKSGHASAKATLDTYSHIWSDRDESTRATVNTPPSMRKAAGRGISDLWGRHFVLHAIGVMEPAPMPCEMVPFTVSGGARRVLALIARTFAEGNGIAMADLIAIGYPDETTAEAAADEARRLAHDLIIEPDAIAVIVRDKEGSYHTPAATNPWPSAAAPAAAVPPSDAAASATSSAHRESSRLTEALR
jgi:hypothetical protein